MDASRPPHHSFFYRRQVLTERDRRATIVYRAWKYIHSVRGPNVAQENDYSAGVRQTVREARQLNRWLAGQSVHLWMPDLCTPDYSCCEPELLAPLEERELYVQAHNEGDMETLERLDVMFLGRLIAHQTRPSE